MLTFSFQLMSSFKKKYRYVTTCIQGQCNAQCVSLLSCFCRYTYRTHCTYTQRDGQAELTWVASYILRWFTTATESPIPVLTRPDVQQLHWLKSMLQHYPMKCKWKYFAEEKPLELFTTPLCHNSHSLLILIDKIVNS